MDEEVWCGLDLQLPTTANEVAGLHSAAGHDALHAPFWQAALADCTAASFLVAGDIDDITTGSATTAISEDNHKMVAAEDMVLDHVGGAGCCFLVADEQQTDLLQGVMHHHHYQREQTYSSSSLSSSRRSLSFDSAGTTTTTTSSPFSLGLLDSALTAAATTAFSPSMRAVPHDPFTGDDAAIMRAMMAVLSSASPSSSECSSPPQQCHESGSEQQAASAAAVYPRGRGGNGDGHVVVRSTTSLAAAPENTAGGRRQQEDEATRAAQGNSSQVHHMMSERKRREKLNDSFQTLRSLLPPCSKKDKTTVLINAARYLKKLEAEVSELEEKNGKLERHVPREDGGAATAKLAQAAAHRRAKVQISRATSDADQVSLTVMVMVECDIVDLVMHVLERLRWMEGVTVLSVDADTYSPQVLLKAIASIKLQITDGDCWNEASFHEVMKKVVHDVTSSPSLAGAGPLVVAA